MDILRQELLKKRQSLSEETGGRKVFKRSEIEQKRIQKLREEEKREAEAKRLRQNQNQNNSNSSDPNSSSNTNFKLDATNSKPESGTGSSSKTQISDEQKIDLLNLPKQEVIRRLRFLKQPVTLFGESHDDRLDRLKYVLKAGLFELDDSDMTEGQTNDFLRDIVELKKRQKSGLSSDRKRKATDESTEDKDGGGGEDDGSGDGGSSGLDQDKDFKRMKANFAELCDEDKILVFFKKLLIEWNQELDEMTETEKRTAKGKSTFATFKQCARYLNPLFKFCRKKVFSMLDTQSVCYAAATCSFFQKCAMDPMCFADIDLATVVPKVNNSVVSTMIHRAGGALRSIKLGVLPPIPAPPFFSSQPLVYSIRNSNETSGFSWNDKQSRRGKESSILTRSCLSSLNVNGGAPGAHLRRLHLYNIERMDNTALWASLSACPSLLDLEIVGLHVELRHTLESISKNCPLLERLVFESSKTGRDDGLKFPTCNEFVLNCPNITTLALKGFKLHDYKARMLVKGLQKLKHLDLSTSYSFTGSFLKNLSENGGGDNLEVMILRDCMHLKEFEVQRFMSAVVAGQFKHLKHLDISNREGLACEGDWYNRCYSASFIPIKQVLEQRPDFCLVAEFPIGSYIEAEQMSGSDVSPDTSDGSVFMSTLEDSGNEDSLETSFVSYEEASD